MKRPHSPTPRRDRRSPPRAGPRASPASGENRRAGARRATDSPRAAWAERGDAACRLLIVALLVATPLIPSESVVREGTGAVLVMLWLLGLAGWLISRLAAGRMTLRGGGTLLALVVFLGLYTLSGLVAIPTGNARYALNAVWQWVSFGLLFFLARQLLTTPAAARGVVAVMLALTVTLTAHAFYQYFVELPANRAAYERDPEGTIALTGIDAPPGSPARRQIVDRIYSREPIATFALTNSLAGFLAPWLVLAAGVALLQGRWSRVALQRRGTRELAGWLLVLIAGSACLLLTKSRTALLATLAGLVLLVPLAGWRRRPVGGQALGLWIAAALVVLLLVAGVIAVGGLDLQVLSEAPKSVLYRLEYWQATAQMIGHHPWFGCGPGNFQTAYSRFKLPQASETVTDPHNFVLEIWATAGTPALLALLAAAVAFLLQIRRSAQDTAAANSPTMTTGETDSKAAQDAGAKTIWGIYAAAAGGVLLAYPVGWLVGFPLHFLILPLALTLGGLTLVLLHPWTRQGRLPTAPLLAALAVFFINLLAAGGIGFPGVSNTAWLLAALALSQQSATRCWSLGRFATGGLTLGALLLVALGFLTLYRPVLESRGKLARGRTLQMQGRPVEAAEAYREAAAADPLDSTPWLHLAQLYLDLARREDTGIPLNGSPRENRESTWTSFDQAVRKAIARDPRSHSLHTRAGAWYFTAFDQLGDRRKLEKAIRLWEDAVERYPRGAMPHARLAWAYHRAGNDSAARSVAAEALRLDELNPHSERKLAAQTFDFDRSREPGENRVSVEQRMRQLRSGVEGTGRAVP